jgi:hypothetical protein
MDVQNSSSKLLEKGNLEIQALTRLQKDWVTDHPALQDLKKNYLGLMQDFVSLRPEERAKQYKAQAAYLTGLAGVVSLKFPRLKFPF